VVDFGQNQNVRREQMDARQAIEIMTEEAEKQGATPNDESGVVRAIVAANLPGRPDAQFYAWFSITCDLADRSAKREGYSSSVDRAYKIASAKIQIRNAAEVR
jgi:hypothetical protein